LRIATITRTEPVGDDEESEFGQFIADEQAKSPYERAVAILTNEALETRSRTRATASAAY
jgi:RNA polymerase primary sigma factor